MDLNTKHLWIAGGYGLNNNYDVSMNRVRQHGKDKSVPEAFVDVILIEFFLELEDNVKKYKTENNACFCGCTIFNSGTNAIHTLFKRIDDKASEFQNQINLIMERELNNKINSVLSNRRSVRTSNWIKTFFGFGSWSPPWR